MIQKVVHHGLNVKRIREMKLMKQETLAMELGEDWNQKKVSLLESKEVIDDALLGQVAKVLQVSPEVIKTMTDDAAINYFNTFNDHSVNQGAVYAFDSTVNPIGKWLEALEENKKLYERLLAAEKEKSVLLQQLLEAKK